MSQSQIQSSINDFLGYSIYDFFKHNMDLKSLMFAENIINPLAYHYFVKQLVLMILDKIASPGAPIPMKDELIKLVGEGAGLWIIRKVQKQEDGLEIIWKQVIQQALVWGASQIIH